MKVKTSSFRHGSPESGAGKPQTLARWEKLPSMDDGCIRDIHVPHPSGGVAVQIGCPADLSDIPDRNDGTTTPDGSCNPVRNVLYSTSDFKGYTKRKRRGYKPRRASLHSSQPPTRITR